MNVPKKTIISCLLLAATGAIAAEITVNKQAFLGVAATPVSETLRAQLDLQHKGGLVITHVADESPAQTADIRKHDTLLMVDDQIIINVSQLAALIRSFRSGNKVTLTLLRKHELVTTEAKLGEKEIAKADPHNWNFWPNSLLADPDNKNLSEHFPEMTEDLQRTMKQFNFHFNHPSRQAWRQDYRIIPDENDSQSQNKTKPSIQTDADKGIPGKTFLRKNVLIRKNQTFSSMDDGKYRIEVKTENGKKTVKVTGAEGKVLYNGSMENDEEWEKVSPEIKKRIEQMHTLHSDSTINDDHIRSLMKSMEKGSTIRIISPPQFRMRELPAPPAANEVY